MIGQTISHYHILEKLGEGGMGVVYKAHDIKLDRDVALKFLPHHLTATADEQARFLQEARAASALNHPNVCTVYDIAEDDGPASAGASAGTQQFIVMEYIDGKTLRQMLPVQKMQTAINYAIQIGEALQEAHSKGIVHRDIKTDNVMVNSRNQIKVMDFGLAKLKGSLKLTKTSSTVGTLAYMAPEQIQGGEVDARSDIFSFGVVLYEMLTGHLPFRGEHEAAMVYSIVNEEPTPIQKHMPDVSSELVHVLNRALEKDPEDRYQSVHDMVIDLRRLRKQTSKVSRFVSAAQPIGGATEISGKPSEGAKVGWLSGISGTGRWVLGGMSILVLGVIAYFILRPSGELTAPAFKGTSIAIVYFENRTHVMDLDKDLLSLLITNLGRNNELTVVSEQRLFDILKALGKQDEADIGRSNATEVAKRAGAKNMLVGQILEVGTQWSAQARLIDVESGNVVNSGHVEIPAKPEEVFSLADKLTGQVSEWLKASPSAPLRVSDAATGSYDAYKHYEKGMYHTYRSETSEAIKSFEEAVNLDSTFAIAHLRLATSRGWSQVLNPNPNRNLILARESIARAKKYAMNLSERDKKVVQAFDAMLKRDFKTSDRLLKDLGAEFPDDKEAVLWSCSPAMIQGKLDEWVLILERAIGLDHSYSDAYLFLAWSCAATGQYDKAISAMKTYIALIPDVGNSYDFGCGVYCTCGRFEEALKLVEEGRKRTSYDFCATQAMIYLLMDQPEKARESVRPWAQLGQAWPGVESMNQHISVSLFAEGRINGALDLLRQDVQRQRARNDRVTERWTHFFIARILLEQNRFDESLKELEELRSLSEVSFRGPFNPWPVISDYYSGLCLTRKGDYANADSKAAAIRTTAEMKIRDPYYLNYYYGLMAENDLAQARLREASASMDRILPWVRRLFPHFRILDARSFVQLGEKTKALKLYDQTYNDVTMTASDWNGDFLDFWIERSKLDYYKARMYDHFEDRAEAIKFYGKAIYNWRNADNDYVNLVDAKARLAKLQGKK